MCVVEFFIWPFLLLKGLWDLVQRDVQAYSIPEEVYFLEDGSINPDWRIHQ